MEFFRSIFRGNEKVTYPESYTFDDLKTALSNDGFTLSLSLESDIQRFGLATGLVLVQDGIDGMRIQVDDEIARIVLYNNLKKPTHRLNEVSRSKYQGKVVTIE